MNFDLDGAQGAIRTLAHDFARNELAPHVVRWDAEGIFPKDALRHAAELGLAGIYVGEGSGGSGLGRLEAALVFEQLSAADTSTAAYLSIHNMVAWMIDAFGDDDQRHRFLPSLLTMGRFASYCLTEPASGSDAASLRTTAKLDGDAYVLDGAKAFISGGGASDLYLVMCRTGDAGPKGISAVLVEAGTPGLSFGQPEKKLGWHTQPTATVHFDGCRVPAENRLGAEGQGFAFAMRGLDGGRVNIAACSLGAAQSCLERALSYVQERRQFGARIADFQHTQFKLADMATEIEAARLMVYRAAAKLDGGADDVSQAAAMAKRFATDRCYRVIDDALQLFGGYGYIKDYEVERYLRDARVHRILEGTNEVMRLIIARRLLARGFE